MLLSLRNNRTRSNRLTETKRAKLNHTVDGCLHRRPAFALVFPVAELSIGQTGQAPGPGHTTIYDRTPDCVQCRLEMQRGSVRGAIGEASRRPTCGVCTGSLWRGTTW